MRGEREELLDDIVLVMDDKEEERMEERQERTTMDRRLQDSGDEIRIRAVGAIFTNNEVEITPPSSSNSIASRFRAFESDEDERRLLDDHIKQISEYESKRIKIDEQRMNF